MTTRVQHQNSLGASGPVSVAAALSRWATLYRPPAGAFVLAAAGSYLGGILARRQGWPLWALMLATLAPWCPVFASGVARTSRQAPGLALFSVLVVTQLGHVAEHVAQMVQIHGLHLEGREAHGVFGALDIEWVHFAWNTWVLVAVILLIVRFPRNRWLWLALVAAGWHQIEHTYILAVYLTTGVAGTPGLLAAGGALAGSTPLRRPDLHFLYNVVETVPLLLAFLRQLCRWEAR